MAPQLTKSEQELVDLFKKADEQLKQDILTAQAKGNSAQFKKGLQKAIQKDLKQLTQDATSWVEDKTPAMYKAGLDQTDAFYKNAYKAAEEALPDFPGPFAVIHRAALNTLIERTTITLATAIEGAGRKINDAIRQAGQEAIKDKLLTGSTVRKTKQILTDKLKAQGLKVIPRKDGTGISLEAYSELVARSTTREATNLATITQTQEISGDLVKMSEHYPTCPICLPLQGRVYSISGKSKIYPPLEFAYTGSYANIHPNCRHVINPYIEEFATDEELEADIEKSKRPFDIEEWNTPERKKAEASLKAFNQTQARKARRWRERQEYNAIKATIPNEAPKTFSAYVNMKKNKSERYNEIKDSMKAATGNP